MINYKIINEFGEIETLTLKINNRYGIIDVLNANGERYSDKLFWTLYGRDYRTL